MVIGGTIDVVDEADSGLTKTIELISPNAEFADTCRKNVEPLFGNKFVAEIDDYDYENQEWISLNKTVEEFEATEMTGLFVKDAPISNDLSCY